MDFTELFYCKKENQGAGEMVLGLRELAVLAEEPVLVPGIT